MKIKIMEYGGYYNADCEDCPGSPPCGWGKTKEEAMAALFYSLMFERPYVIQNKPFTFDDTWLKYIKMGEPIIINETVWEDPLKSKPKLKR